MKKGMGWKQYYKRVSKKKSRFGLTNILLLLFAILMLVSPYNDLCDVTTALNKYNKCTAEITDTFDFKGGRLFRTGAEVKFIVGGKYFERQVYYYKSSWKVGKEINIYYNPDNPKEIVSMDDKKASIFRYSFIGIAIILGAILYDSSEERRKSRIAWENSRLYLALANRKAKK